MKYRYKIIRRAWVRMLSRFMIRDRTPAKRIYAVRTRPPLSWLGYAVGRPESAYNDFGSHRHVRISDFRCKKSFAPKTTTTTVGSKSILTPSIVFIENIPGMILYSSRDSTNKNKKVQVCVLSRQSRFQ